MWRKQFPNPQVLSILWYGEQAAVVLQEVDDKARSRNIGPVRSLCVSEKIERRVALRLGRELGSGEER